MYNNNKVKNKENVSATSNGMKVLMISTDRKIFEEGSGVRQRVVEYGSLVEELHVIVFSKKSLGFSDQKIAGNVWVYPTNSLSRWLYIFGAKKIGKKIVSKEDQWLVSTQDPFETGLVGKCIAKKRKAKLHIQIHTDFLSPYFLNSFLNEARVRMAKRLLPKADGVRVVSNKIADSINKAGIQLKMPPLVLPVFVDIGVIRKKTPRLDLRDRYKQFDTIVLAVSRLEKEKNIRTMLAVFKNVVDRYPKTGLVIVGEGGERDALQKYTRNLSIANNVIFEGSNSDTLSFYKIADVFLHTSSYEGYGMVLVEAAASDCPIVTTNVGIAEEFFKETNSAHVCAVGDEECLATRLLKTIEDKEFRNIFALKAQSAIEGHIKEKNKEEYLAAYKESWKRCF